MPISEASQEISLALDNDIFTHWRSQQPYALKAIAEYQTRHKIIPALTSTTIFETLSGIEAEACKSTGEANERIKQARIRVEPLIRNCIVLPFDQNAAAIAAYIFPRLSQANRNKHWRDVFIAATVLAHGYGLATRNKRDFELIAIHLPPSHSTLPLAVWTP